MEDSYVCELLATTTITLYECQNMRYSPGFGSKDYFGDKIIYLESSVRGPKDLIESYLTQLRLEMWLSNDQNLLEHRVIEARYARIRES